MAFVSILTTRLIPEEFLRTVLIENSAVDRNAKRQKGLAESHCSSELGAQSFASQIDQSIVKLGFGLGFRRD